MCTKICTDKRRLGPLLFQIETFTHTDLSWTANFYVASPYGDLIYVEEDVPLRSDWPGQPLFDTDLHVMEIRHELEQPRSGGAS